MPFGARSTTILLGVLCLAGGGARAGDAADGGTGSRAVPVVVELFTSQGCSSCPPADALLRELDGQPLDGVRLIVLSQHVDYWNGLGWKDPYSSREFSVRQRRYGDRLAQGRVYTPQMVVDGTVEFVGNRRRTAFEAISAAARRPDARVAVDVDVVWTRNRATSLRVAVAEPRTAGMPFDVVLAITESGLENDVRRGENAGRPSSHAGVVRSIETLGAVRPEAGPFEQTRRVPLDPGWNVGSLRAVVFVQGLDQGPILGARSVPLSGPKPR